MSYSFLNRRILWSEPDRTYDEWPELIYEKPKRDPAVKLRTLSEKELIYLYDLLDSWGYAPPPQWVFVSMVMRSKRKTYKEIALSVKHHPHYVSYMIGHEQRRLFWRVSCIERRMAA